MGRLSTKEQEQGREQLSLLPPQALNGTTCLSQRPNNICLTSSPPASNHFADPSETAVESGREPVRRALFGSRPQQDLLVRCFNGDGVAPACTPPSGMMALLYDEFTVSATKSINSQPLI